MRKIILTKEEVEEIIFENRFQLGEKEIFLNLDEEELVLLTGKNYGLEVNLKKLKELIKEIFGKTHSLNKNKIFSGAVLQIEGNYSVEPYFFLETAAGSVKGTLFIFHQTYLNQQHRLLAKKLVGQKIVKLFPGCDEEYLYEAISEVLENLFFETIKISAPGLPLFIVKFDEDGGFRVEAIGQ